MGLGTTVEGARKNAIQKAVRKALGEIVDAETITNNEEVIKDEVITYSDGFVSKTLDISGPEKDPDLGLFSLTIQAEVIRSKVVKRLKEVNVKVVEIDGNSLFAQALSKMDQAEGGKSLLAKALNEDLDPAKLIKCDLIHRDTNGKLVRGSFGPNAIKILGDNKIELTTLWEISLDSDAYYKQALPRISQALNQVSKRKISSNFKRKMAQSNYNRPSDTKYHSYPTMKPVFYGDKGKSCIHHEPSHEEIYFGWGEDRGIDLEKEPSNSPWRISASNEEFFVAFELRSNFDRTESDFEIHVLDFDIYMSVFTRSISRVLPTMICTAKDKEGEIVFQQKILEPKYLTGNNKDKKLQGYNPMKHEDTLMVTEKSRVSDPLSSKAVGICRAFHEMTRGGALSFTISPEFVLSAKENSDYWGSSKHMVSNSLVMEVKEKISILQAKQITSLTMQPIPQEAN